MKKGKYQYKSKDFFMLRTPIQSYNFYKNTFTDVIDYNYLKENIKNSLKDVIFQEAILTSTNDLFESIKRVSINDNAEEIPDNVLNSIVKYLIRTSTRTTPYGLFSGVTVGGFDIKTQIILEDKKKHKKRARVDMEWLYGIIDIIEKDDDILPKIKVKYNTLCYQKGNRLVNPYISNGGIVCRKNNNVNGSIRLTNQVRFVEENSKNFIGFEELHNLIKAKNPKVDNIKINNFLKQLLKNEYLISELRPPLINVDPMNYLLEIIEKIDNKDKYYGKLKIIDDKLKLYNSLEIGDGREIYQSVYKQMKDMYKCNNYIQVDLKIIAQKNAINYNVSREAEKIVDALIKISSNEIDNQYIKSYKDKFIEKYGYYMEVSILELLDGNLGLGSPYKELIDISSNTIQTDSNRLRNLIKNRTLFAIKSGKDEIELTDKDIEYITSKEDNSDYNKLIKPSSLEVFFSVLAKSKEDIDSDNFKLVINPCVLSLSAGKVFGRFRDFLNEYDDKLDSLYDDLKMINCEDLIIAEISNLPKDGRLSNLCLNYNNVENQISVANNYYKGKRNIDIKDIYIGVDKSDNRFYVKSHSLDKKILIRSSHMLNDFNDCDIVRFLREICDDRNVNIGKTINNLRNREFIYMPRVSYSKTILQLAKWRVSREILGMQSEKNEEIKGKFLKWKNKWNVPRYVYYQDMDNRLLLDLHNDLHIEQLLLLIRKSNDEILLTEVEFNNNNIWVEDIKGEKYFNEIVIPFFLDKKEEKKKITKIVQSLNTLSNFKENSRKPSDNLLKRNLFPGDENWFYFKLYGDENRVDEFIGEELNYFGEELLQNGYIEKHFFIRYWDPMWHIRFRIKLSKGIDVSIVLIKLNGWFNYLRNKGLINRVCVDTYEREIERYGGIQLIENMEEYFNYDSEFVEKVIEYKQYGKITLEDDYIGMSSIVSIMEGFGLDYGMQEKWLSSYILQSNFRDEFRKKRHEFIDAVDLEKLHDSEEGKLLIDLMNNRKYMITQLKKNIDLLDEQNEITNTKEEILSSIIHMFCNRFKGNNEWEKRIRALTRHSLYALVQLKKHQ